MMRRVIHILFKAPPFLRLDTGVGICHHGPCNIQLVVDLIKGHPIFHFSPIPLKHRFAVFEEEINQAAVFPSTIPADQMIWHFKVGQRNNRLNFMFQQFVKQSVIKPQAGFVWQFIIPIGKNSRPVDGGAEAL